MSETKQVETVFSLRKEQGNRISMLRDGQLQACTRSPLSPMPNPITKVVTMTPQICGNHCPAFRIIDKEETAVALLCFGQNVWCELEKANPNEKKKVEPVKKPKMTIIKP